MPDPDLVDVFRELCWARVHLWNEGLIADFGDAIDPLQQWAEARGLIERIGQDAVQAIMAAACGEARHG